MSSAAEETKDHRPPSTDSTVKNSNLFDSVAKPTANFVRN